MGKVICCRFFDQRLSGSITLKPYQSVWLSNLEVTD